jgi:hypothetical protein
MRSDLRNLMSQQEILYADSGRYSANVDTLGLITTEGVHLDIRTARNGWTARAWHDSLGPDVTCVTWIGAAPETLTTVGGETPRVPAEVLCDEFR